VGVKDIVKPFDSGDGVIAVFLKDDVDTYNGKELTLNGDA
jgi:hypothetical protein